MHPLLKKEIERLGGIINAPQSIEKFKEYISFYVPEGDSWEEEDPLEKLVSVSEAIRIFDAVKWPYESVKYLWYYDEDEEPEYIQLTGVSENYAITTSDGNKCLMYIIAYTETTQNYFAIDLLDSFDNPAVYKFDHAEPEEAYRKFDYLSSFLKKIHIEGTLPPTNGPDWEEVVKKQIERLGGTIDSTLTSDEFIKN